MSFSDKISWVGGMMGLFTGFSVISALEITYWLWFKVLLHKNEVEPIDDDIQQEVQNLKSELEKNDSKVKILEVWAFHSMIIYCLIVSFYFHFSSE